MKKTILEEAVEDVQALKKAAEENAKNLLVEAMSPKLKEFIASQLGQEGLEHAEKLDGEMETEALPMGAGHNDIGAPHEAMGMYEIEDDDDGDEHNEDPVIHGDSVEELDPAESDEDEDGVEIDVKKEAAKTMHKEFGKEYKETKDAAKDSEKELADSPKKDMDETVEVTAEDLKRAFSSILKQGLHEAEVSKGFGDMTQVADGDRGLEPKEKEANWNDVVPPDSEDYTVAEQKYQKQIAALQREVAQYAEAFKYLKKNLHEMNLFNAKLVYTNRLLQGNLTNKQRLNVVESIDRAKSKREVELVFNTLSEHFKIAGVLSEKKTEGFGGKGPKASRFTAPSSTLNEGKDATNAQANRWAELAGLID